MVKTISEELAMHVYRGGFIHCRDIHDGSCEWNGILKFVEIWQSAVKFYVPLHVIPVLMFKRKKL